MSTILYNTWSELNDEYNVRNEKNKKRTETLISSSLNLFYKDVTKPIVIDREKAWGTPGNLNVLKNYVTPKPKIIFTVRTITDILASFVSLKGNYLLQDAHEAQYYVENYLTQDDLVCEYIMRHYGDVDKSMLALSSAFVPENAGIFYIVEYENLVNNPEETMSGIYKFLELDDYKHNFSEIIKPEVDMDILLGLPDNLHEVHPVLTQSLTDTNILSDYIKNKYSGMEFWRDGSLLRTKDNK
jgi:sulfotransferase